MSEAVDSLHQDITVTVLVHTTQGPKLSQIDFSEGVMVLRSFFNLYDKQSRQGLLCNNDNHFS